MTSLFKNQIENDTITTDMKSAGIHLLNKYSFRPTQLFFFYTHRQGQFCGFIISSEMEYTPYTYAFTEVILHIYGMVVRKI